MSWGFLLGKEEEMFCDHFFLLQELQHDVQKTKEAFLQDSTLLDRLPQPAEPNTHVLLSGQMHSLQRASYLEKMLLMKTNEFKVPLSFLFNLKSWTFAHSLQFLISCEVIVISALWAAP